MRIVAPYTAGGAADLLSRLLCEKLPAAMGQPCVVENKPGAGGIIGFDFVAKSEPDGHTLVMAPNDLAIIAVLPALSRRCRTTRSRTSPGGAGRGTPIMVGAHPSFPAKSFRSWWLARANNGKVNFTTCGPASPQHLAGEMARSARRVPVDPRAVQGLRRRAHRGDRRHGAVLSAPVAHFNTQADQGGEAARLAVLVRGPRSQFAPDYPTVTEVGLSRLSGEAGSGSSSAGRPP